MAFRKIVLAAVGMMTLIGSADALQISPRCERMRNAAGCTCAVENGGGIFRQRGSGRLSWYSTPRRKFPVNEAYLRCVMEARYGSSKPLPDPSLNDFSARRAAN